MTNNCTAKSLVSNSVVFVFLHCRFSPVGIASIIMGELLKVEDFVGLVQQIGLYMVTVLLGLFIHGCITLPLLFLVLTRSNPIKLVRHTAQALLTAFGTSSRFVNCFPFCAYSKVLSRYLPLPILLCSTQSLFMVGIMSPFPFFFPCLSLLTLLPPLPPFSLCLVLQLYQSRSSVWKRKPELTRESQDSCSRLELPSTWTAQLSTRL